ncbi:hypothetical protein JD844_030899, partial [Phrynosoma platyrhinos]
MVLEALKAKALRQAKRYGLWLLAGLYRCWPECLTPPFRYRLVFGMLYPAYASYKAVKTKNIREYVRWMMYWIVFALFMATEMITDTFISWFPFYYEIKMAFVVWLLSPYTRGASLLYRKFIHPTLSRKEKEIDQFILQTKERGYETLVSFGKKSLNVAATAAVQAATKSQGALAGRLRSFSMQDLHSVPDSAPVHYSDPLYLEDEPELHRRPIGKRTMEPPPTGSAACSGLHAAGAYPAQEEGGCAGDLDCLRRHAFGTCFQSWGTEEGLEVPWLLAQGPENALL